MNRYFMNKSLKRKILYFTGLLCFTTIAIELSLSIFLGLGNPPLYVHSDNYQYIYAPNQDVERFGARTMTNSYSMRSRELSDEDEVRILKIGDSVTNGGAILDHENLASTLLENKLQSIYESKIRVLNISAGGWSPEHEFAYLKKNGLFDAKLMLVEWNGEDLYSEMNLDKTVGVSPNMPEKKPIFAIQELFNRYIIPELEGTSYRGGEVGFIENENKVKRNEKGINDLINLSKANMIPLVVYLHPNKEELLSKTLDARGLALLELLKSKNVTVYNGLSIMEPRFYRDGIHLNEEGHKRISDFFAPILCKKLDSMKLLSEQLN